MRRHLSWFIGPLLLGASIGAVLAARPAGACRPAMVFWVLQKAEVQPAESLADAEAWPREGQLVSNAVSLWEADAYLRLEYAP